MNKRQANVVVSAYYSVIVDAGRLDQAAEDAVWNRAQGRREAMTHDELSAVTAFSRELLDLCDRYRGIADNAQETLFPSPTYPPPAPKDQPI